MRPIHGSLALLSLLALGGALASACSTEETSSSPPADNTGGTPQNLGGAGGDSANPDPGTGGTPQEPAGPPQWLSETGLYAADGVTLAEGVRPFTPRYPLWTDSAAKERWIWLPPGTQIDATDPDRWQFPPGTKLWKEFTRDDVRVETRLLERRPDGSWWMVAYQWNDDQTDAEARPDGVENASGTPHDIPSSVQCEACHVQSSARVLGFGALQLNHAGDGLTLSKLLDENLVSPAPAALPEPPGNAEQAALLGALHANCGHCHQPTAPARFRTDLELWLPLDKLDDGLEGTPFYQSTVDVPVSLTDQSPGDTTLRIAPGSSSQSALLLRISQEYRNTSYQMPPLGTEESDPDLVSALTAFIDSL